MTLGGLRVTLGPWRSCKLSLVLNLYRGLGIRCRRLLKHSYSYWGRTGFTTSTIYYPHLSLSLTSCPPPPLISLSPFMSSSLSLCPHPPPFLSLSLCPPLPPSLSLFPSLLPPSTPQGHGGGPKTHRALWQCFPQNRKGRGEARNGMRQEGSRRSPDLFGSSGGVLGETRWCQTLFARP